MMAAAIQKRDLRQWASSREIVVNK
jgi:hypothetical protein